METSNGNLYFVPQIDNSKLQADANKTVQSLKTIGTQAEAEGNKMDAVFSKLGKTMTGVFAGISIGNFVQQMTQVRANIEMLEISFKTLLGSEEKAASLMNDMRKYALNTPLLLKDIASGAQMLLGFNVEAERVMPILKQIGDISMGSAQRFQSLTLAFSQMSAAGKLMGQDLLQMINAGFNPLTVIAQQTGKSVAQLKEDMSQGAINSQMVADAFAAATGEGGKFNGMLDKMSKGLQGMKSNLQGAVEDMFNEVGRNSQGLIAGTLEFATEAVKNYKKVGEALTALIGVVGAYKAAELASLAIIRTESAEAWAAEATQIKSLLGIKETNANADVQQALAKGYITEAVAAEVIALREEVAVKTTALQLTIKQAELEIAAATKERAAAEQRRKRAIENVKNKEQELMATAAGGTTQEKAAAVTALDTANVEKNNAVKAKSVATSKVKAAQTKKETAEQTLNTLGTEVNTGVQTKNITSTSLLTAAKKALAAITAKLNKLLISNHYAIAAAAVAALAYGIYKLVTYQTAAEKAQKNLNKAFAESQAATSAEVTQLNIMYGTLNAAKKGTQAYKQAKDAIQKKYGEYIANIEKETGKVFDLTQGYEELKKAIREAANEKAYQKYIETAADDFQNETSKALEKLRNNLMELYGEREGQEIYVKIKTSLEDGDIRAVKQQLAAIADEFQGSKSFETMYNTISNGEPIVDKMFNKEYNQWANITVAANKYIEALNVLDKTTKNAQGLFSVSTETKELEELQAEYKALKNKQANTAIIVHVDDSELNKLEKLRNNLMELYGEQKGQEIYVKIKTSLEDGNKTTVKEQLAAIADEFKNSKVLQDNLINVFVDDSELNNKLEKLRNNLTELYGEREGQEIYVKIKTSLEDGSITAVKEQLAAIADEFKNSKVLQDNLINVFVDDSELNNKLEKLRNNLMELYGEQKGQEIYVKIKTSLEDGDKTTVKGQLAAIADEFKNSKVLQDLENRLQNNKIFKEDNVINFSVNFTDEDEARMKYVEDRIKEILGESGTVPNVKNTTVSELTKQIEQGKKDLAALQKSAQNNGYTPTMVEDIQNQEKALKSLIETYQTITGKKYELPDLTGQLKDRTKIIEAYSQALKRATSDEDIEIRAAKIELMPEGYDKEIESINLQYDKLNDINNQRQQQLLDDLNERNRKIWEAANPDKVKAGEEYSSAETLEEALLVSDMSEEDKKQLQLQRQMIEAYADLANKYKADATAKLNKETLAKYLSFEQQKLAIIEKYATEEAGIVKATDDEKTRQEKIGLLNKAKAAEIKAVDDNEFVEVQKSADLLVQIYQRAGDVSSKELKKMLSDTKKLINYLKFNTDFPEGIGITKEQADSVKENLSEIEEKYVNLLELLNNTEQQQQGGGSYMFSGFVDGLKNIKKASELAEAATKETDEAAKNLLEKEAGTAKAEAIKQLASGAADAFSYISRLADSMKELAEATGDDNLSEGAEVLSSIGQNLGAAAQGFASGGWIGAIVGGVTDIIEQTIQSVTKAQTELTKLGDFQTDFARQMLFHSLTLNEDLYENLFGVKSIQKAADAYQLAKKAMAMYNDRSSGVGLENMVNNLETLQRLQRMQKSGTLQNMQIKVRDYNGWDNFWGKEDEYMSLKDLAPDLWDEAGEFDVEAAQIFLDTNKEITVEQRQQIENAIELKEKYDEAMEAVHADLQTYIGTWADDITDIIYNSIIDGGDAFAEWEKTGSKAIVKLGKQLVNQFMIQTYLETFTEQLEATYGIENATERALALGDLFKTMGEGVADNLPMWQSSMKSFFNAMGVDVSALDSNLSGMAASIGGLSEDTGLAIAGAANSIIYYAVGQYNELTTIRQLIEGYTGGMAGTGNNNNIVMSQLLTIQQSALGAMYDIHTLVKSINENTYKIERAFNGVVSPINSRSGAKAINVNA